MTPLESCPPSESATADSRKRDRYRSRDGRYACFAKAAVGIDARVDQLNELSDPLGRTGTGEGVNTPAIQVAESVPTTVAILANRTQRGRCGEPRFALDPGAVASGPVRRPQAFQHRPLETQSDDRLVRRERRRLRLGQADPLANWKRLAQPRVPVLPRTRPDIFASDGEDVECHEPHSVGRGRLAGKHSAGDRGEVLRRLAIALGDGNELAVKRRAGRNVDERCEQRSETSGEIGAVA